jgi:hypothetical protein
MPAFDWELKEAVEEKVTINPSYGPKRIIGDSEGKVSGIELKRCTSIFDQNGNFAPKYNEEETTTIECDTVILAIGQATDIGFLMDDGSVDSERGCIKVESDSQQASNGIFAGGDAVTQPGTVIDAIAAGRAAAAAMDTYIGGDSVIDETLVDTDTKLERTPPVEGFADRPRKIENKLAPEERFCYDELCQGFSSDDARAEAQRCLCCHLRLELPEVLLPPENVLVFNSENVAAVPEQLEGVFHLLDEQKNILVIKGTADIKAGLQEMLENAEKSKFFKYEEDKMYSKRESEEIQVYLQKHGQMPPGDGASGDDMDDLF